MDRTSEHHINRIKYRTMGWAICLLSAVLFSSKAIAIKLAYVYSIDATTLLALRMIMALPIYLVMSFYYWTKSSVKRKSDAVQARYTFLTAGFLGYYLASLLDFMGLSYVSAQLERIVLFSYPMLVIVLGYFFFGQPLQRNVLIALPICWAGIAISMLADWQGAGRHVLLGSALVFGSAVTYAIYTLIARGMIQKLGSGLFTSVAMSCSAVASVVHAIVVGGVDVLLQQELAVYGYALYMAVFATVIPSYLFSEAVKRLGSDVASTASSIGPVMTSAMAVVILHEPFGLWQMLGLACVLLSIGWLSQAKE
ncbi:DMT family transporter [Echinimonas agarilytica]|uniref:DMT family transporter n=1 Tax=Echinimonas agarilytica TaxID=1215918 RepID=A0AA41W518_9GAMM|nr:DMT family transporter [Echinimonas agarilytica]MCM2679020.1 DMT family transporter [Echinimonas agarilytica]